MTEKLAAGHDYGNRSMARTIGETTIVECEYAGGIRTPSHFHARPYFGFVFAGGYREAYRQRTLDVGRGAVAWHPPEERHVTLLPAVGLRVLRVELAEGFVQRLFQRPLCDEPRLLGREHNLLGQRIRAEVRQGDELTPIVLEALLTEAVAALLRQPGETRAAPWLHRTWERIHDSFKEQVSLAELAADAGVHPAHLTRAFRRQYGCTIGELMRHLRIDYARELLALTAMPLAEIALETGFSSQSHFAVAFRRVVGITPGAYRRQMRG